MFVRYRQRRRPKRQRSIVFGGGGGGHGGTTLRRRRQTADGKADGRRTRQSAPGTRRHRDRQLSGQSPAVQPRRAVGLERRPPRRPAADHHVRGRGEAARQTVQLAGHGRDCQLRQGGRADAQVLAAGRGRRGDAAPLLLGTELFRPVRRRVHAASLLPAPRRRRRRLVRPRRRRRRRRPRRRLRSRPATDPHGVHQADERERRPTEHGRGSRFFLFRRRRRGVDRSDERRRDDRRRAAHTERDANATAVFPEERGVRQFAELGRRRRCRRKLRCRRRRRRRDDRVAVPTPEGRRRVAERDGAPGRRRGTQQELGHGVRVEPGAGAPALLQRGRVRPGEGHDVPGRGEDGEGVPGRHGGRAEPAARGHPRVHGQQGAAHDEDEVGQRGRHTALEPGAPGHAVGRRGPVASASRPVAVAAPVADAAGPGRAGPVVVVVVVFVGRGLAEGRVAPRPAHRIKRQAD